MASSSSPLPWRLVVLYASQTGNAIDTAERVGQEAERGGCPAVDVLSMDSFNPSCLPGEKYVLFVVSTMGQGEPPDSMKVFWTYFTRKHLGVRWLEGLHYAVFGLGDSAYEKYNLHAKKLDRRLCILGAKGIIRTGLGNDLDSSGYEGALDLWLLSLWKSLNKTNSSLLPRRSDAIHPNLNILGDAKVEVIYYSAPQDTTISEPKMLIESTLNVPALKCHNEGEPQLMLQMVTNQHLTKGDSDRDVRHFELEDRRSVNPDYAKGYKTRGMANAMLRNWEEDAPDLYTASNMDYDDEINAVLKKVEHNAHKIVEHRKKYESLQKEREEKKAECDRLRRRAEAQAAYEKTKSKQQSSCSSGSASSRASQVMAFL